MAKKEISIQKRKQKGKPLLSLVREIFKIFRFRPMQLVIGGMAIPLLVYLIIDYFYPLPFYAIFILVIVIMCFVFLGLVDLVTELDAIERKQAAKENKAKVQSFEYIEKELKEKYSQNGYKQTLQGYV